MLDVHPVVLALLELTGYPLRPYSIFSKRQGLCRPCKTP
jgi:hypothetical protein